MLAATEPQVIRHLKVLGPRWWTQPRHSSEIQSHLVASAELDTTTTTEWRGEVGETRQRESTDVGSDQTKK